MSKHRIRYTLTYLKLYKKYVFNNFKLKKSFDKTINILLEDPFYPSLKTHKVDTIRNKEIYSSRVNGDWRVGWIFDKGTQEKIIICLEIGTHSGSTKIYK
jgi:mRNA-degrading endonuclease YafQ of YafQ-DinJ toxin-antitoxin module